MIVPSPRIAATISAIGGGEQQCHDHERRCHTGFDALLLHLGGGEGEFVIELPGGQAGHHLRQAHQ
jgi:hypothetical protein